MACLGNPPSSNEHFPGGLPVLYIYSSIYMYVWGGEEGGEGENNCAMSRLSRNAETRT